MTHRVQTVRSSRAGFNSLALLADSAKHLFGDHLEVDFSDCPFFEAHMAAPLGAVLARVADNFNTIKIINLGKPVETILRKNGFLTSYGLAPLEDSNNTTLPFRRIQLTDGRRFEGYLKRHLKFLMDFIKLNNGKLQIVSRFGFYEFANNRESYTKLAADFPGTVVNIEINTGDTASYRLVTDVSPDDIF